jgi:lysophospholipase L1-like esterase
LFLSSISLAAPVPDTEQTTFSAVSTNLLRLNADSQRIMPLGDSITEGLGGHYNGYRGYLYALLSTSGYSFSFVGSEGSYPFKHEGHGGWRADEVFKEVYGWLTANPADIVLLHIGTNDITEGKSAVSCATDINYILDQIDEYEAENNVEITVILARIINRCYLCNTDDRQETTALNMEIQNLADIRRDEGDQIIVVDMENGAGINYNDDDSYPYTDGDMYDDVHPNDSGYAKIAQVWFNAINAQSTTTTSVHETISTTTTPLTTTTSTTTIPPMSIYGKVTGDINKDVIINLYKAVCEGNSLVSATSINADGFYIFAYVSDGNYTVEVVYSGCSFSPSNYINVSPHDNVSSDFSATCTPF